MLIIFFAWFKDLILFVDQVLSIKLALPTAYFEHILPLFLLSDDVESRLRHDRLHYPVHSDVHFDRIPQILPHCHTL